MMIVIFLLLSAALALGGVAWAGDSGSRWHWVGYLPVTLIGLVEIVGVVYGITEIIGGLL